jgi:protein involved in polysaccharide export with SLBB domain
VDLSEALRTGDASGLPELKAGDTIVIPGVVPGSGATPAASPGEGVGVLGEVNHPGLYPVQTGQDLWTVLATAGGLTARGNLSDVRVLTHSDGGQNVAKINLREVLQHGSRAPIGVKAGDVVVVMPRSGNAWQGLLAVLELSRDAANALVIVDYFSHRNTTTH